MSRRHATHLAVRRFWDERAAAYDDHFDQDTGDGHALQARLDVTLRLIGQGPGTVLDAGMGPGRLVYRLARRGWNVFGTDVSPEMVEIARNRLPEARTRLFEAAIEVLPFEDETFDCVAATGVLEYADVPLALAELARVLRPGGLAVISYPNPWALYHLWKSRLYYPAVRFVHRLTRTAVLVPHGAGAIPPPEFGDRLARVGFELFHREFTSVQPLMAPLDALFPSVAAGAGRRLEGRGEHVSRILGTQVVYSARKAK